MFEGYQAAKRAGKTHKIWQIAGGITTRQSHERANGQKVRIDEAFRVGGEALFLPNDPEASLSETANCRCSVRYVGRKNKPVRSVAKITRTVYNDRERITLVGGRYATVTVQNFQPFVAPVRITLSIYPLDINGDAITVFQNVPVPFTGHILPIFPHTYKFDAGPVGVSNRYVLIAEPDSRATGADIFVNVTLEVSY